MNEEFKTKVISKVDSTEIIPARIYQFQLCDNTTYR